MKVFVWEYVGKLTHNYHEEGGAVAVAESLEAARALLGAHRLVVSDAEVFTEEPDMVIECDPLTEPKVFVFPDAGCC